MNGAQLHLVLNHFPIVTFILSEVLLIWAWKSKSLDLKKAGLLFVILGAILLVFTYLTGEPAESVLEKVPGFSEALVHEHEEAAEFALIFGCISGVVALAALYFMRVKQKLAHPAFLMAIFLTLFTCTVFLRTAHLGGLIKHDEIRTRATE